MKEMCVLFKYSNCFIYTREEKIEYHVYMKKKMCVLIILSLISLKLHTSHHTIVVKMMKIPKQKKLHL